MNPDNESQLRLLLAYNDSKQLPERVVQICRDVEMFYCQRAGGGPLSVETLALICVMAGERPPKVRRQITITDFSTVPVGTHVWARWNTRQGRAIYAGEVADGTVGVRFLGEEEVRECLPCNVRRLTDDETEQVDWSVLPENTPITVIHPETGEVVTGKFWKLLTDERLQVTLQGDHKNFRRVSMDAVRLNMDAILQEA